MKIIYNHNFTIGSFSVEKLALEPLPKSLIYTPGSEFCYGQYDFYLIPQLEYELKELIKDENYRRAIGVISPDYNQPHPCLNLVQLYISESCLYMIASFRAMNEQGYEYDPIYLSHLYMSLLNQTNLNIGGITVNVGIFYK